MHLGSTKLEITKKLDNPNRNIFKKAHQEIYRLMETDAFPKFLVSQEFDIMSASFLDEAAKISPV